LFPLGFPWREFSHDFNHTLRQNVSKLALAPSHKTV
jgi:hypothetical protein